MITTVEVANERPAIKVDHVALELIAWAYREFLPRKETRVDRSDPYLSPNTVAVPTRIPIWVQWGSAEALREDIEKFVQLQSSTSREGCFGTYEIPHAPRDIFALAPLLGWKSEISKAVEEAIRFLDNGGAL
ncbi:hypothetical protein DL771_007184 [Monosporascus sp. 5C6A]|nr:hypothetical protein DL771_007184 [Monosporascus sp. 5C6A]